jgi:hypothetical protein
MLPSRRQLSHSHGPVNEEELVITTRHPALCPPGTVTNVRHKVPPRMQPYYVQYPRFSPPDSPMGYFRRSEMARQFSVCGKSISPVVTCGAEAEAGETAFRTLADLDSACP